VLSSSVNDWVYFLKEDIMNTAIKSADDRTAILCGDWRSRVRIA
jgi:hypothetical protein